MLSYSLACLNITVRVDPHQQELGSIMASNRRCVQLTIAGKGKQKVELIDQCCDQYYVDVLSEVPRDKQAALVDSGKQVAEAFARRKREKCCAPDAPVLDKRASRT